MADLYSSVRQRPALMAFAEALGSASTTLRRDDNGDWPRAKCGRSPLGHEIDDEILGDEGWASVARQGTDDPNTFAAYLRTREVARSVVRSIS